ncbi:MAG: ubiquinol-cytochrome c reductase iron-sulfur subunit [Ginsengibacter sp.]
MDRKEFFSLMGGSAASLFLFNCIGCSKPSNDVTAPATVDFTIDLSTPAYSALNTNGGYLAQQGVLIARTMAGNYIAVQQSCTHQNYSLIYEGQKGIFYCNNHGSAFAENGTVLNPPANRNLKVYKTTLTGTSLRIYS